MLGSLLGRIGWSDLPSSFTYSVDEEIGKVGVFTLHRGQEKSTKENVTVFVYDKKKDSSQAHFAVRAMKKSKSIKHPSFLRVDETADVASGVYIVTEPVTILENLDISDGNASLFTSSLSWNLYVLAEGISFLHQHAAACHGYICPQTIYVTPHGEWKIGGLDISHSQEEVNNQRPECLIKKFNVGEYKRVAMTHPSASSLWTSGSYQIFPIDTLNDNSPPYVLDRIAFASLAAWAYARAVNQGNPSCWSFRKNERFIPELLHRLCKRFTDPTTFRIESFDWEQMKSKSAFFRESDLVQCMLFFANIALKGNWDKELFYEKTLPHLIEEKRLSPEVQTNFILPRLVHELETAVIPPSLLPIMVQLFVSFIALVDDTEIFQRDVYSCYKKLMLSNERSIRYYLLQSLPSYQHHLKTQNALQLFDAVALGLSDSSPELRDITLKAMLIFLPKVATDRACIDRGFKRMARCLQTDEVQYIRTNAIICYAKLVESSSPQVIAEYIAPQFLVGMKDTFNPARLAALQGLCTCMHVLSARDKALKYLPAICPRLLDEDPQAQSIAFHALDILSASLRSEVLPRAASAPSSSRPDSHNLNEPAMPQEYTFQSKALSIFSRAKGEKVAPPPTVSLNTKVSSDVFSQSVGNQSNTSDQATKQINGATSKEESDEQYFKSDSEDDWGDLSASVKDTDAKDEEDKHVYQTGSTGAASSFQAASPPAHGSRTSERPLQSPSPELSFKDAVGGSPSTESNGAVDNFWDSFNATENGVKDKKKSLVLKTKRPLQKRPVDAK